MARAWIEKRPTASGASYRVRFRIGGRESAKLYGGSFPTKREAERRREWISDEIAAMRVPNLTLLEPAPVVMLRAIAERWRASRVDVAEGTAIAHRVNLDRIFRVLGDRPVHDMTSIDVVELVTELHRDGLGRESIRKTKSTLAMVFDFAGVSPNPARDTAVKLPREEIEELTPPDAGHVAAVFWLLPSAYRLPLLVLDATGMRVGELESLLWGDVDEPDGRWRVRREAAKTRRPRWVPVPLNVFEAVVAVKPREDRELSRQVFAGFGADKFRTALGRACKAAAVPAFSPHDLRHRRATLWHMAGIPVVEAAAWLGHSPTEHVKTYAHATLSDRSELDYRALLSGRDRVVPAVVPPSF